MIQRSARRRLQFREGKIDSILGTMTQGLALLGALVALCLVLYAARGTGMDGIGFLAGVIAWVALPYAALFWLARRGSRRRYWPAVLAVATGAVVAVRSYLSWLGFIAHPDAQGGLLFIFVPLYQLAFVGTVVLAGVLLKAPLGPLDRRP